MIFKRAKLLKRANSAPSSRSGRKRRRQAQRLIVRDNAVRDRYTDERNAREWIDLGGESGA